MTSGAGVTYAYDGDGERVEDSSPTLYWYGMGGRVLAETDTSGDTVNEYIFFDGRRIARRDASGNVYYYSGNALGSATITTATGTVCYDADFYPFGGELTFTNTCGQSYKFAGMRRDATTGLDHTRFRQYSSNLGRWYSPDPLGGEVMNPQSLNRYAYVDNNPTTFVDPLGLSCNNGTADGNGNSVISCTSSAAGAAPPPSAIAIPLNACGEPEDFPTYVMYGDGAPCLNYNPNINVSYPTGPTGPVGGGGGGGSSTPPPRPALVQRIANVAQCASSLADTLSVANLTGLNKNPVTNAVFSNVFSSATDLILGTTPDQYVPSGASVVATTKGASLASRGLAAGAASASSTEVDPGLQFIFSSVPATTVGETVLGRAAVSGVKALGDILAYGVTVYDAGVYAGALDVCAQ